jgi:hypothetical protein
LQDALKYVRYAGIAVGLNDFMKGDGTDWYGTLLGENMMMKLDGSWSFSEVVEIEWV